MAYYLLDQGLRARIAKEHFASVDPNADKDEVMGAANSEIEAKFKVAQGEMWNKVMSLCSQNVLKDISTES